MMGLVFFFFLLALNVVVSLMPSIIDVAKKSLVTTSSIGGQSWGDFSGLECQVLGSVVNFNCMGDLVEENSMDNFGQKKQAEYNLNVGRAVETLRRELPGVFVLSNLDFSIFSASVSVCDSNQNRMTMQKTLYATAVKSLRMAASLSSIYPSMNVRSIEYIAETSTIQCRVDVVLPDSVRVDGQVSHLNRVISAVILICFLVSSTRLFGKACFTSD